MKYAVWSLAFPLAAALWGCGGDSTPVLPTYGPSGNQPAAPAPGAPGATSTEPGTSTSIDPACSPDVPRTVPAKVSVMPEQGESPYVDALRKAQKDIRVMVYLMGVGGVIDTLKAKAKAGVDVRVILDKSQEDVNQKYATQLQGAGVKVIWSDPNFTYMHAKVIIVDGKEAVISTGNYSIYQIQKERNFAATLADPHDLSVLGALFEADWTRKAPDLSCTRLLVSPVNAKERLLDLIDKAQTSLYVESMQFAERDVQDKILAKKKQGLDVKIVLADPNWIDANAKAAEVLKREQIPTRWRPNLHVKSVVADGKRAYLGSENFSWTSLTKNREVGVIVDEPENIQTMLRTFDGDWAIASEFR